MTRKATLPVTLLIKSNVSYTTFVLLFLRSTIGYLRLTCRKTNPMVNHKKKKKKKKKMKNKNKKLILYKSCTKIVQQSFLIDKSNFFIIFVEPYEVI
jgi:hypothetical protein